jgi:hypothetical protein
MDIVVVTQGLKRWDSISYEAYGNDFDVDKIQKANPTIPLMAAIPSGTSIIIPLVESTTEAIDPNNLPPWKK